MLSTSEGNKKRQKSVQDNKHSKNHLPHLADPVYRAEKKNIPTVMVDQ